jgi:hypothetical protein
MTTSVISPATLSLQGGHIAEHSSRLMHLKLPRTVGPLQPVEAEGARVLALK